MEVRKRIRVFGTVDVLISEEIGPGDSRIGYCVPQPEVRCTRDVLAILISSQKISCQSSPFYNGTGGKITLPPRVLTALRIREYASMVSWIRATCPERPLACVLQTGQALRSGSGLIGCRKSGCLRGVAPCRRTRICKSCFIRRRVPSIRDRQLEHRDE